MICGLSNMFKDISQRADVVPSLQPSLYVATSIVLSGTSGSFLTTDGSRPTAYRALLKIEGFWLLRLSCASSATSLSTGKHLCYRKLMQILLMLPHCEYELACDSSAALEVGVHSNRWVRRESLQNNTLNRLILTNY